MKPEDDSAFGFRMMAEFLFAAQSGKSEFKDKPAKMKQFLQVLQCLGHDQQHRGAAGCRALLKDGP